MLKTNLTHSLFGCLIYLGGKSILFKTKVLIFPSTHSSPPKCTTSFKSPPPVFSVLPSSMNSISKQLESQTIKSSFVLHFLSLPCLILQYKPHWYHVPNIIFPLLLTSTNCTFPEYISTSSPSVCLLPSLSHASEKFPDPDLKTQPHPPDTLLLYHSILLWYLHRKWHYLKIFCSLSLNRMTSNRLWSFLKAQVCKISISDFPHFLGL